VAQLTDLAALELSRKLGAGEISASELMRATLDRVAAVNGGLNAIVSLRDEADLLAEAAAADAGPRKGWLHGIPMAPKDLVMTRGIRSTKGSPVFADHIPEADDLLAQRLKDAGAIFIGKTNTPEFGLGSNTFNAVFGVTANPYDASKSCGGSSGGAGVALAARMLSVADGSDMMGSLRNPAAWNNVYGMRPSWGLVPGEPQGDEFLHPLATSGPMARTPRDLAALLETLAGHDPRTISGDAFDGSAMGAADLRGKRIGWLGDWGGAYAYEPGIAALCESGLRVFEDLGASVEPVAAPHPSDAIWEAWITLRSWAHAAALLPLWNDPTKRERLKEDAQWEIERGLGFSAMDVHDASVLASDWYRRSAELFQTYDALVLPTCQVWPFASDMIWPPEINGHKMDTYHRWMEVTIPIGLIGLPAISLPVGFGENGLPMGMQIFGPRGADLRLLQMAESYHQATDWPNTRPPEL